MTATAPGWQAVLEEAATLAQFQDYLNDLDSPSERKEAVIAALCAGFINRDDTQLLFDVYDLATA